ncbi:BRO-N domain-containing protein [Pasteurella multocida]|uniref:BRO-N domain-containing protein n=1 Tax=Pasteurella multocida TaxID=747 RepID=UPI00397E11C9
MTTKTQLSTFLFETHIIRTLSINNEPWFIAKDICRSLNIANVSDALLKLDGDEKMILDNTLGLTESIARQVQEVNLVSESGMYTLILRCRDAVKKGSVPHRFRKWVTSEVLPQIRKTGKYEVQPQQLALPEPARYVDNLAQSEEALALFIKMYSFCFQAHEMQEKLRRTNIPGQMENEIGGHYLHNFKYPLEQTMAKAKKFIQSNTERLALVKAFNHLLN